MRERTRLASQVEAVQSLERDLAEAVGYAELADEEGDEAALEEARKQLASLKDRAARAELEALLSGEADGNDAYVEINSGAGGTESNDWALMLMRMYSRWAQAHGIMRQESSFERSAVSVDSYMSPSSRSTARGPGGLACNVSLNQPLRSRTRPSSRP